MKFIALSALLAIAFTAADKQVEAGCSVVAPASNASSIRQVLNTQASQELRDLKIAKEKYYKHAQKEEERAQLIKERNQKWAALSGEQKKAIIQKRKVAINLHKQQDGSSRLQITKDAGHRNTQDNKVNSNSIDVNIEKDSENKNGNRNHQKQLRQNKKNRDEKGQVKDNNKNKGSYKGRDSPQVEQNQIPASEIVVVPPVSEATPATLT